MKIKIVNGSSGFIAGGEYEATKQYCGYWAMSGNVGRLIAFSDAEVVADLTDKG